MNNQDWVCAICLEDHSTDLCTIRPCGHVFHSQCIHMAFQNSIETCPLCRAVPEVIDNFNNADIPDEPPNDEIILNNNNYNHNFENNFNINNLENNAINVNNNFDFYLQNMLDVVVNINLNLLSEYVRGNINIFIDNHFRHDFTNEIRNRNDLDDIQKNFITNTINNCVNQYIENNNLNNNLNNDYNNNQIIAI